MSDDIHISLIKGQTGTEGLASIKVVTDLGANNSRLLFDVGVHAYMDAIPMAQIERKYEKLLWLRRDMLEELEKILQS